MNSIVVRRAEASDAHEVARLLTQLGYPVDAVDVPGRIERIHRDARAVVLVAVEGAKVRGLATAHALSVINRVRDVAWLTALVVDESARGTGVGRALVNAVESFARAAGCERLSVTTHLDRAGAHAFYERIGFELTGRRYGKVLP